jgi:predicted DsbA family dithiol-disulfide isomerase
MSASLTIDIFSDVVCPWCLIGATRLDSVLAAWPEPLDVTITYHPFLLDPSVPEGGVDLREKLTRQYGLDAGSLASMFSRVSSVAQSEGLSIDFSKQTRMYPTLKAHVLISAAEEKGTQKALVHELFTANFIDAKDVSDDAVLAEIASHHGFSVDEALALLGDTERRAQVREEVEHAAKLGIRGVPFFIFNERLGLSGAQNRETFEEVIRKALAEAN